MLGHTVSVDYLQSHAMAWWMLYSCCHLLESTHRKSTEDQTVLSEQNLGVINIWQGIIKYIFFLLNILCNFITLQLLYKIIYNYFGIL